MTTKSLQLVHFIFPFMLQYGAYARPARAFVILTNEVVFCIFFFFQSLVKENAKWPNLKYYGGLQHRTLKFHFSLWIFVLMQFLEFFFFNVANHPNLHSEVNSSLSLPSSLRKLTNVTLRNNFFPTSDGVIYYEPRLLWVASIVRQISTIASLFPGEKKNLNNQFRSR